MIKKKRIRSLLNKASSLVSLLDRERKFIPLSYLKLDPRLNWTSPTELISRPLLEVELIISNRTP